MSVPQHPQRDNREVAGGYPSNGSIRLSGATTAATLTYVQADTTMNVGIATTSAPPPSSAGTVDASNWAVCSILRCRDRDSIFLRLGGQGVGGVLGGSDEVVPWLL